MAAVPPTSVGAANPAGPWQEPGDPGAYTDEDVRAYRQLDSDSVPVLSVHDFVPSDRTQGLPVRTLVYRFVFFDLLVVLAAGVVVEAIHLVVGA
jgi:hypothetical protein